MKTKLIKLQDKFILVSDEKPKSNDVVFINNENYINEIRIYTTAYGNDNLKDCIKVLAISFLKWTHNLPSIDFSLLSEEDCKKIGWVDVEKLAEKYKNQTGHIPTTKLEDEIFKLGFTDGFKTAQSLNDKMFNLETILSDFYVYATNGEVCKHGVIKEFVQSLQQTEWDVEVEMDKIPADSPGAWDEFPKIVNGKIKITKIL